MENLRRFKEKNHPLPKAPKQRCGFEIPPEFSHAIIGQEVRPTLVYDSGKDDKDRILVWSDKLLVSSLLSCSAAVHISGDGTFKTAPLLWAQQYTILFRHVSGRMVPIIFALLPIKLKGTYIKFFTVVRSTLGENITSCIFDFEQSAVLAFRTVFPRAEICLWLFHLARNVLDKFKELGVIRRAAPDVMSTRRKAYYNLMAVAFLPVEIFLEACFASCDILPQADSNAVLSYFIETYGLSGIFQPSWWNKWERVRLGLPRTNNSQEGFHRKWNGLFAEEGHLVIWKWINVVHRVINQVRVDVLQLDNGAPFKRRKVNREMDVALQRLVLQPVIPGALDTWFQNARGALRRVIPSIPASSTAQPDQSSGDGPVFIGDALDDEHPDAGYEAIIPPFDEDIITLDLTADDVHTVQGTQHPLANAVIPTGSGIGHEIGDAPGGTQPSDVTRQAHSQTQQQPSLSTEPQASAPAEPSSQKRDLSNLDLVSLVADYHCSRSRLLVQNQADLDLVLDSRLGASGNTRQ
ncbi:hypothetical protein Pmar_PMAR003001 [Perkinsus marinus ATCC 50983]|uniref:MULE transposase domain-containing protein n=1 Tax=Perkinsus marinus (strain ATCC 50983 / TXsc) TaxID=423536 RepID=C5LR44_PERM5|nr:hypothetical protein Pmar_PMAR003001 [Perkinsus marinus ATCC 50983]EER00929.1 hypothetical protein Pmar_PMAR003001 [Perkinsus marinus ATCC 50983]|eukprot:XP_002768211.1 hypothetical protein Pmar_PMAR003001 [Perkinsus marinus ATCC 50983]